MVRPFEGKQIVDIETESLMVLMKLKINISEAVQQFWQEMQEKYAKKDLSLIHISEPTRHMHVSRMPSSA